MLIALSGIAVVYVAVLALLLVVLVAAVADRDIRGILAALFFLVVLPFVLRQHLKDAASLALRATRARIVHQGHEELQALVARVAALADLPRPRVALVHSWSPNAFAVGVRSSDAVVAVTTELVRRLEPAELEAVVAHELSHIANRDGVVMTLVAAPAMAFAYFWHDDDLRGKVVCVFLWPVWVWSLLLMWTISRYREYIADRGAAVMTGAPEQLMSALQSITSKRARGDLRGGRALSAFCIVSSRERKLELLMDHPPIDKRLARLAEMARELGKSGS
jgi:heat shock protein HtpX